MTAKRKHHAPRTTDQKVDALRVAVGLANRRERQELREARAETRRLLKALDALTGLMTRAVAQLAKQTQKAARR